MTIVNKQKRFINEKELSSITGIALPTLRRWRHERRGPSYIKICRMVRYDYDLAMAFMKDHQINLEA